MSLFAATGGALWEPQRTTAPRDPERPAAPLVAAPGREDAAALADRAMRTLLALTGDQELVRAARASLIRAGVVRVDREDGE